MGECEINCPECGNDILTKECHHSNNSCPQQLLLKAFECGKHQKSQEIKKELNDLIKHFKNESKICRENSIHSSEPDFQFGEENAYNNAADILNSKIENI